ncbi:MAG: aminotransferase class IV [Chitinophagaceae bacterium]|nr:aminotransferase class IV [Chitinophagaceae bacterium]
MLLYLNDQFLNEAKAGISVNNRSFRYGDGCFETMKLYKGRVLQADLHMERLWHSLQLLQFEPPTWFTPDYILQRSTELAQRNQHAALARIRCTVFRGDGGLYDAANMRPHLLLQSWALNPENNKLNSNGLVLDIYSHGHKACDALANLKSNNYLLYGMAALAAKQQHTNDMLVLNQHGRLADSTIANLWWREGDTIFTPALTEGPVAGTMRRYLLQQLPQHGYQVQEDSASPERLLAADEVWLSNAIYGIKWVRQLGQRSYGLQVAASIHQQVLAPLWA